ncbi:hypothetical protein AB0H43_32230 [Hamadaea sp. NPDC050747]|uniref:hypothetical protein n=1 Tax=Hamadaea sp. NPDC050747 TaxID=3155789 RepID=UPI0033DE1DA4
MLTTWVVAFACPPIVLRRCRSCAAWGTAVPCIGCDNAAGLTVSERMNARLHATRSAGPAVRQRCRHDRRAASASAHAMAQSQRHRLGQHLALRHRRVG